MSKNFKEGDVVKVNRGIYDHFGVYIGNNKVVHFQGDTPSDAKIKETSLAEFEKGEKAEVCNSKTGRRSTSKIVNTAKKSVNADERYNVLTRNCEHVAREIETGKAESRQVDNAIDVLFNPVRAVEEIGSVVNSFFGFFK